MPTDEKDNRFEELLVRLMPFLSEENINYLYEMRNIYSALKQENSDLKDLKEDRLNILKDLERANQTILKIAEENAKLKKAKERMFIVPKNLLDPILEKDYKEEE